MSTTADSEEEYAMSRMRRGPALILHDCWHLTQAHTLRKVLVDLRFNPVTCRLISSEDSIQRDVAELSGSAGLREDWCVLVAVLASMRQDKILVTPDTCVATQDIWQPFLPDKCPLLKDKPKIFFVLDAQNNDDDDSENDYLEESIDPLIFATKDPDMLFVSGVGENFVAALSCELASCLDSATGLVAAIERAISPPGPSSGVIANLHSTLRFTLALRSRSRGPMYDSEEEAQTHDRITLSLPEAASLNLSSLKLYRDRKYSGAIALMDEVLDISRTKLGPEHHETLNVMSWKCELLLGTGHHNTEALELLQDLLEKRLRISGDQHFSTLIALSNKAFCLHNLKEYSQALILHNEVIEKKYKAIGEQHPFTLTSLHHKAMTLNQLNRHSEALELMDEVLEQMHRVLGDGHREILTVLHNKAFTLRCMERYDEALLLYSEVIERRSRTLGAEHPRTLVSMANKASCLEACARHDEAFDLLEEVLEKRIRVLGEDHEYTKMSADRLVNLIRILDA